MVAFNVSNTKPTFTEISYTKLRTFLTPERGGLHARIAAMAQFSIILEDVVTHTDRGMPHTTIKSNRRTEAIEASSLDDAWDSLAPSTISNQTTKLRS
jgi:hypothetical protein